jgi:hypothetical protein
MTPVAWFHSGQGKKRLRTEGTKKGGNGKWIGRKGGGDKDREVVKEQRHALKVSSALCAGRGSIVLV